MSLNVAYLIAFWLLPNGPFTSTQSEMFYLDPAFREGRRERIRTVKDTGFNTQLDSGRKEESSLTGQRRLGDNIDL